MITVVLLCLLAFFAAELVGGIFHWWEDRYGNPEWPIIGKYIVLPNIEHHQYPAKICQGTYWYRNGMTIIVCAIGAIPFYWCWPMLLFFLILSQMNEFHSWSHKKSNRFIRFLQQYGLMQSPRHHSIHHEVPYNKYYCVMTNYLNPILTKIKFWEFLELVVFMLLFVEPRQEREEF